MLQDFMLTVTPQKIWKGYEHDDAFTAAPADAALIAAFRVRGSYAGTTFLDVTVPRSSVAPTMKYALHLLRQIGPLMDQAELDLQDRLLNERKREEEVTD